MKLEILGFWPWSSEIPSTGPAWASLDLVQENKSKVSPRWIWSWHWAAPPPPLAVLTHIWANPDQSQCWFRPSLAGLDTQREEKLDVWMWRWRRQSYYSQSAAVLSIKHKQFKPTVNKSTPTFLSVSILSLVLHRRSSAFDQLLQLQKYMLNSDLHQSLS